MKLVDLPFFVELGARLEEASTLDPQGRLFDAYIKLYPLRQTLERLSSGEHVQLSATTHDLASLKTAIDGFFRRHFQDEQAGGRARTTTPAASSSCPRWLHPSASFVRS
jgi:hypothetical protein